MAQDVKSALRDLLDGRTKDPGIAAAVGDMDADALNHELRMRGIPVIVTGIRGDGYGLVALDIMDEDEHTKTLFLRGRN